LNRVEGATLCLWLRLAATANSAVGGGNRIQAGGLAKQAKVDRYHSFLLRKIEGRDTSGAMVSRRWNFGYWEISCLKKAVVKICWGGWVSAGSGAPVVRELLI